MKKIFRLANAELSKIFMRPSMFVLSTVLIVALVFSFFFFAPTNSKTKFTYGNESVSQIYTKFDQEQDDIDNILILAKTDIEKYLKEDNNTYTLLRGKIQTLCNDYNTFFNLVFNHINEKETVKNAFKDFRTSVRETRDFLSGSIDGKYVHFFITTTEYNNMYTTIKNLYNTLPSDSQLEDFTAESARERLELVKSSFEKELFQIEDMVFNKLEQIEIDSTRLEDLLNSYYYPNIQENTNGGVTTYTKKGTLLNLETDINVFYAENAGSSEDSKVNQMNELIAKYYDYVQICKTLISNNFELLRIGNKSDDSIVRYNGFSSVSIYNLKLDIATSKYFYDLNNDKSLENDSFGYEYLDVFNFNKNSGTATNAFDFTFFAMQILSSLIILFAIFFVSSAITGEQNSGTLKMTATRPYSRNKIFSGKLLACFNVSIILLLVSFVASFAVGVASFGLTNQNVLVVMNASTVFTASPFVVMLIYFVSLVIDLLFYIGLSILVSMLVRPTTINTAISSGIFLLSSVLTGIVSDSWIRFIPTTHTGLFKFFTGSKTAMFSYSIVPGVNLITSAVIVCVCIVMFDLISRMLFARRSIDK